MKASDAVARFLIAHGVQHCFELVGGMITHLIDSISQSGKLSVISMHHEQAAAFAAEGAARQSKGRQVAVAMGTSGPGATNLITGIGSCWFDSIPCIFITGQVNVHELKGDLPLRQQGFQELDIVHVVRTLTKYSAQVTSIDRLLPELHRAFSLAVSGRQGPVLLDVPNNIQRMEIPDAEVDAWLSTPLDLDPIEEKRPAAHDFDALYNLCRAARKPLICFGGGARWSQSLDTWIETLDQAGIPYVSTLMGQERIADSLWYFHMIGSYGNREANWAVQNCDLLIAIGARLDVRQTGADASDFARAAKIVQIDIDAAQLGNRVHADLDFCMSAENFFQQMCVTGETFANLDKEWLTTLRAKREMFSIDEYPDWKISPTAVFQKLDAALKDQSVHYVCDVGNHQMWAAQNIRLRDGQAIHHSGGMGAMGFGLPAAIGIALSGRSKTILITGDGSLQVNIQELDTLNRLDLDVLVLVLNNYSLGMVKNFQDMYFDGRDQSTRKGYSCPSFFAVAQAFGILSRRVEDLEELQMAVGEFCGRPGPALIEVAMDGANECRPRLTFGKKLDEQFPERS